MNAGSRLRSAVRRRHPDGARPQRSRLLGAVACAWLLVLAFRIGADAPGPGAPTVPGRQAAMTFDDLPVISVTQLDAAARQDITRRLLRGIRSYGAPATGFVNEYGLYGYGREAKGDPDPDGIAILRMWLDAGLELGNHSFAHTDLHATSPAAFEADVIRGEAVTRTLLQRRGMPLRYFRHPYLHTGRDLATREEVERFLE